MFAQPTLAKSIAAVLAAAGVTISAQATAIDCGATEIARHFNPQRTRIWSTRNAPPSLLFVANLDVNTDGASRSYHPADPRGRTLALNNIANATSSIHAADGSNLACAPRQGPCFEQYIRTFEAARDSGWATSRAPQWRSDGMIPWQKGARAVGPCLIADGPYQGYFVSATAFVADASKAPCDQSRYLDSLRFHGIVLPRATAWAAAARNGDLAVVRDLRNDTVVYGIVGDRGPRAAIGEGSVAIAAALAQVKLTGTETAVDLRKLVRPEVLYLVFPGQGIRERVAGPLTQETIDQHARAAFESWGGDARLTACVAFLPRS